MDLSPHIQFLLRDLRARLETVYGDRLHAVVLYGSYARGEETPESDVDVMVVLEGEVNPWEEIRRMSEAGYKTSSAYEELVTLYPVSRAEFEASGEGVISVARDERGVHMSERTPKWEQAQEALRASQVLLKEGLYRDCVS